MRLGAIYPGLMAAIRSEELLGEAMRRGRSTDAIRHRQTPSLASRIRRALRPSER
jgi:hypothetical protein